MQEPSLNAPLIDRFADALRKIEDERKERCIHCDEEWYSIHYKDGVCSACRLKGLPGRAQINRQKKNHRRTLNIILLLIYAAISVFVFSII